MATFLNRQGFSEAIKTLIMEAEEEILIIVPYIKTSNEIFELLQQADERGVEITIIYKDDGITAREDDKLESLENLNLLCHEFLHAKAYMNEEALIIGSMNLYDYSERNNREIGILFENSSWEGIFEEANPEFNEIVSSSTIVKTSRKTEKEGLDISLLVSEEEQVIRECKALNKAFINKKFKPEQPAYENTVPYCKSYVDNIDVYWSHRKGLVLPDEIAKKIFDTFQQGYETYMFPNLKTYWNNTNQPIYLYQASGPEDWGESGTKDHYLKWKAAIDEVVEYLKPMIFRAVNG